jgi:hypothetical protein
MDGANIKKNYELVSKPKIRAAPVPSVVHSPHPTPETRVRVKPPLVTSQGHPSYA